MIAGENVPEAAERGTGGDLRVPPVPRTWVVPMSQLVERDNWTAEANRPNPFPGPDAEPVLMDTVDPSICPECSQFHVPDGDAVLCADCRRYYVEDYRDSVWSHHDTWEESRGER